MNTTKFTIFSVDFDETVTDDRFDHPGSCIVLCHFDHSSRVRCIQVATRLLELEGGESSVWVHTGQQLILLEVLSLEADNLSLVHTQRHFVHLVDHQKVNGAVQQNNTISHRNTVSYFANKRRAFEKTDLDVS